jgi:hypothetical protein
MEQRKILSGMTLTAAIASFHISFIGQLKYPTKGAAVAIVLQRKFAKVDEEGEQSYFFKNFIVECCLCPIFIRTKIDYVPVL